MALSDKEISALYFEALGSQHLREQDRKMVTRFAHAIEAEVHKQDTELIQQMLHELENVNQVMPFPVAAQAITAARSRLGEKT